jgi:chromosome segregation ATPase
MAKGKHKNPTNRNQDHSPSSERSAPTLPSPGHHNKPKKLDPDLKAYLMMIVEDIKKDFNNSLKEIKKNTAKQVEDLKEETQKSLKELQEKTTKQVMELNKTTQDLKREIDTIKKTQSEATLEIETLGKKTGTIDESISNRIQEMEERISGPEDSIHNIHNNQRKYKTQKDPNSKQPGNPGHNEKTKPTDNRS